MPAIRVLRAADSIGGNCIEVVADDGRRILLDAGRPLDAPDGQPTALPDGLDTSSPVLAVLLSHAHQDHVGMLGVLPDDWPVYCGEASRALLDVDAARRRSAIRQTVTAWRKGRRFRLGPFAVTPMLADHSAFDAHMLLIEVDGKTILYSGDFRDHGRKGRLTRDIIQHPPRGVDALIMEGTNIGAADKPTPSEKDLEEEFARLFRETGGRVFVACAGANIDRLVTLYRACLRTGRRLAVDLYTLIIMRRLGRFAVVPRLDWDGSRLRAVVTGGMMRMAARLGEPDLVEEIKKTGNACGAAALMKDRGGWVVLARGGMVRDFAKKGVIPDASDAWVWSLWRGYYDRESSAPLREFFQPCGEPKYIHTSGHAPLRVLKEFADAVRPRLLVPVHGDAWPGAVKLFDNIRVVRNGERIMIGDAARRGPSSGGDAMSVEFLNDFRQRLANGRGKSGGYPADFSYAVRRDADGRVVLVLDAGQGKREGKFWRRPDVWGLAILDELMGEFPCGESEPAPAFGLELHVDRPEGVNERAKYEALRRRVAYLAEVNPGLDIRFFSNGGRLALDGSPGSDEMVREDYRARDDKGKPGRLEKDLQSFLFGKGLFDDAAPAAGASPSVARGNIRLSLLGDDFAFGAKAKGNLMREFPTGAFRTVKSRDSRVLPTWFIDFLTVNRNGDLAIIEMKFIDVGAAALEDAAQILDYALYFRHYRSELAKHLATHGIVWKEDVKKICAYLVSNAFHSRMERLWAYYNRRPDLLHLKRIGMGYAIQQ